ncbi:hypothetical protein V6Z11_D01G161500 [Gossypium hirsutum]
MHFIRPMHFDPSKALIFSLLNSVAGCSHWLLLVSFLQAVRMAQTHLRS